MAADEEQPLSEEDTVAAALGKTEVSEHDTLKYHLLGPSLTKAGQDSVDQHKVRISKASRQDTESESRFLKLSTMPRKAPNSSTTKNTRTRT